MTKMIRLKDGKVLKVESNEDCLCACPSDRCWCGVPGMHIHCSLSDDFPQNCPLQDWQDQPAVPKAAPEAATGGYLDTQKVLGALCKGMDACTEVGNKHGHAVILRIEDLVERGEFDAKEWLCSRTYLEKALAEKDAEIARLKGHFDDAQHEIQALQHENVQLKDRIAQQDKELKDLGNAIRERDNSCSNCNGTGVEHTIWQEGNSGGVSSGTCHVCGRSGQKKGQKEPTVPEMQPIDILQAHTAQIEACQDRLDKHDTDIGALTLRLDNLEREVKDQREDYHAHIRQFVEENAAAHKTMLNRIVSIENADRSIS